MRCFYLALVAVFISASTANANLRDRIKERIIERQQEKPAPTTQESPSVIKQSGDFSFSIAVRNQTRFYRLHVPKTYAVGKPAALLVVLHGGGGDMSIQSTDEFYHQISKSESEGFVALFANGYSQFKSGKFATWNAGKCCGQARDTKSDDVAFIKAAVEKTKSQMSIDAKRIFVTGMSNGGMMAYRLACELPDLFRAIAAVAGTDNTDLCPSAKPVSVLHIHAKDDDHVLFAGGAGKNAFRDPLQVTDFNSVPSTIEKWRAKDGCELRPRRVLEKKGAYCDLFETCKAGSRVELCVTDQGGHSWPGGKKPSALAGGTPSNAISANDVMWDFFNSL